MLNAQRYMRPAALRRKAYIPGKPVEEVQRELGISDIVKLASNENMLGTSPKAMDAMARELLENTHTYPESSCHALRQRLAEVHGLTPQHFLVDNGEDGVIVNLGLTFISPEDEVIYGGLSFPAFENITMTMGAVGVPVPMTGGCSLDIDGFMAAISPRTKVIFVCNPNNPTATVTPAADFERLMRAAPETALVVSDEAYYEYVTDPAYPQTIPLLAKYPNLIVLRTFSKVYGLAGVRVGYAVARPDLISAMMKTRQPFPVNRIAQAGALAALDDTDFVRASVELVVEERQAVACGLGELGLECDPGQTNFVYVDLGRPAGPVGDAMLGEGVITRPLGPNGAPNALRITIGTHGQNQRMLAALAKALGRG